MCALLQQQKNALTKAQPRSLNFESKNGKRSTWPGLEPKTLRFPGCRCTIASSPDSVEIFSLLLSKYVAYFNHSSSSFWYPCKTYRVFILLDMRSLVDSSSKFILSSIISDSIFIDLFIYMYMKLITFWKIGLGVNKFHTSSEDNCLRTLIMFSTIMESCKQF